MHMIAGVLQYVAVVASFAEAWIEILLVQKSVKLMHGRLLRGGVH